MLVVSSLLFRRIGAALGVIRTYYAAAESQKLVLSSRILAGNTLSASLESWVCAYRGSIMMKQCCLTHE